MREKLLDLMKSEGLKPGQLADLLGINPAGISHILAGRNKPGFDLLQKILRRFPQIDPDWLLLDSPTMYRADRLAPGSDGAAQPDRAASAATVGSAPRARATVSAAGLFEPQPAVGTLDPKPVGSDAAASSPTADRALETLPPGASAEIARIVVFYADGTFDSYSPTRR